MAPERGLPQLSLVHCESTWDRPVGRMGDKGDHPTDGQQAGKRAGGWWWWRFLEDPCSPLHTLGSCGRLRRHRKKQRSDEGRLALTKHSHLPALQAWSGRAARPGHHSEGQDSLSATCKAVPTDAFSEPRQADRAFRQTRGLKYSALCLVLTLLSHWPHTQHFQPTLCQLDSTTLWPLHRGEIYVRWSKCLSEARPGNGSETQAWDSLSSLLLLLSQAPTPERMLWGSATAMEISDQALSSSPVWLQAMTLPVYSLLSAETLLCPFSILCLSSETPVTNIQDTYSTFTVFSNSLA